MRRRLSALTLLGAGLCLSCCGDCAGPAATGDAATPDHSALADGGEAPDAAAPDRTATPDSAGGSDATVLDSGAGPDRAAGVDAGPRPGALTFRLRNQNLPAEVTDTDAVDVADVDGDGDLDLGLGRSRGDNRLYRNDGDTDGDGIPNFSEVVLSNPSATTSYARDGAFVDVDQDGTVDFFFVARKDVWVNILSTIHMERHVLFALDGQGGFADVSAELPLRDQAGGETYTYSLLPTDLDHDGHTDVLLVGGDIGWYQKIAQQQYLPARTVAYLYLDADGDGDREFARAPDDDFIPGRQVVATRAAAGDLDGDGDRDLVLATCPHSSQTHNMILIYDASLGERGKYVDETAARIDYTGIEARCTTSVHVGDLDGDADQDIVFVNHGAEGRVFLNQGGSFAELVGAFPADGTLGAYWQMRARYDSELVDLDRDGDLDLLVSAEVCHTYLNDGSGSFSAPDPETMMGPASATYNFSSISVGSGDLDGDGFPDAVTGGLTEQSHLWINDQSGGFVDATNTSLPPNGSNSWDAELADLDADGDLDIVEANGLASMRIYINVDGRGSYGDETEARLPNNPGFDAPGTTDNRDVEVADLNGDGLPDLFVARKGDPAELAQNKLYYNRIDAPGFFSDQSALLAPESHPSSSAVLCDLDGDGDLDIALADDDGRRVVVNNGGASFEPSITVGACAAAPCAIYDVECADLNEDGRPDLVFASRGLDFVNRLFINTSAAVGLSFVEETAARLPSSVVVDGEEVWDISSDVHAVDLDGDGHLDLVIVAEALASMAQMTPLQYLQNPPDLLAGAMNRVFLNRQQGGEWGYFLEVTTELPLYYARHFGVATGDLDLDGRVDLFFAARPANNPKNGAPTWQTNYSRVFLNQAGGAPGLQLVDVTDQLFADHQRLPVMMHAYDVKLGDVDGDGDLDALVAVDGTNRVLFNQLRDPF